MQRPPTTTLTVCSETCRSTQTTTTNFMRDSSISQGASHPLRRGMPPTSSCMSTKWHHKTQALIAGFARTRAKRTTTSTSLVLNGFKASRTASSLVTGPLNLPPYRKRDAASWRQQLSTRACQDCSHLHEPRVRVSPLRRTLTRSTLERSWPRLLPQRLTARGSDEKAD